MTTESSPEEKGQSFFREPPPRSPEESPRPTSSRWAAAKQVVASNALLLSVLLLAVLLFASIAPTQSWRTGVRVGPQGRQPGTPTPPASPGFRFSVGDGLVNVNNGAEIGVVVHTEMAHTFRNGTVGRAYIIARPNGVEMDMVADVLEQIAGKR